MAGQRRGQNDIVTVVPERLDVTEQHTHWKVPVTVEFEEENIKFARGDFGTVFRAQLVQENAYVAIKRVVEDQECIHREVEVMRMLNHCNVVKLRYFYYTANQAGKTIRNVIMEFVPSTVLDEASQYWRIGKDVPLLCIKLWMYQLFRALAYIHSLGICHRNVEPDNVLVDDNSGVVKLCDFHSAKKLVRGIRNNTSIGADYFRAPELLICCSYYTFSVDIWSAGCVLAQLIRRRKIFNGDSDMDQLEKIIWVLGTPSAADSYAMNPIFCGDMSWAQMLPRPWKNVFPLGTPQPFVELCGELLKYNPKERLKPFNACAHSFFDELREEGTTLPGGTPLPPLFNFTAAEQQQAGALMAGLMPH